jgi:hypothetical protein
VQSLSHPQFYCKSDRKSTPKNKVWRKINTINIIRIKLSSFFSLDDSWRSFPENSTKALFGELKKVKNYGSLEKGL